MKHQDQVVVNVREYITDLYTGKLHPTKKGIILSLKDQSLKKEMKTVNQLLKYDDLLIMLIGFFNEL